MPRDRTRVSKTQSQHRPARALVLESNPSRELKRALARHPELISAGTTLPDPLQSAEEDHLSEMGFGLTFLEKFVLAVIDAYPQHQLGRRQRLKAAMRALVGRTPSTQALPDDRDESALLWMAEQIYQDQILLKSGALKRVRSDNALAFAAVEEFFEVSGEQTKNANAARLREKISGTYFRKQRSKKAAKRIDHRKTYLYRAVEHDHIAESLEAQGLQRLRNEFAKWGIKLA